MSILSQFEGKMVKQEFNINIWNGEYLSKERFASASFIIQGVLYKYIAKSIERVLKGRLLQIIGSRIRLIKNFLLNDILVLQLR